MARKMVFDREHAKLINQRRKEALDSFLPRIIEEWAFKNALDAGCGVGIFSEYMRGLGNLHVTAFDAREGNVDEARIRYPGIDFLVCDVEDPKVRELGETYDLVLCLGLLYHLENPFAAIRNLRALTKKILIIESMVTPSSRSVAKLVDECIGDDQSLNYVTFIPSEACLVKMLYRSGFKAVYRLKRLPDHDDFRKTINHKRRRTIVLASNEQLDSPLFSMVEEPLEPPRYLWHRAHIRCALASRRWLFKHWKRCVSFWKGHKAKSQ